LSELEKGCRLTRKILPTDHDIFPALLAPIHHAGTVDSFRRKCAKVYLRAVVTFMPVVLGVSERPLTI
jgi:hypothetical protein